MVSPIISMFRSTASNNLRPLGRTVILSDNLYRYLRFIELAGDTDHFTEPVKYSPISVEGMEYWEFITSMAKLQE